MWDGVHRVSALVAAGVPASTVSRRCRTGRWTRLLPGVVATGEVGFAQRCTALELWQPAAVLSHRSAAHLWGFHELPDVLEATVPRTANVRTPAWLVLHRRLLPTGSVTTHRGRRVVTPERAVLDCLTVVPPPDVDRVVDDAVTHGLALSVVRAGCERAGGVAGVVAARRQAAHAADTARSEPERRVARALARRGWRLPGNRSVHGWVVDLVDERSRTVVEIDGREVHSEPAVFRSDRPRQDALLGLGWFVLRYAAADALADPDGVAEEIIAVVRRRRAARR